MDVPFLNSGHRNLKSETEDEKLSIWGEMHRHADRNCLVVAEFIALFVRSENQTTGMRKRGRRKTRDAVSAGSREKRKRQVGTCGNQIKNHP